MKLRIEQLAIQSIVGESIERTKGESDSVSVTFARVEDARLGFSARHTARRHAQPTRLIPGAFADPLRVVEVRDVQ